MPYRNALAPPARTATRRTVLGGLAAAAGAGLWAGQAAATTAPLARPIPSSG